MRKLSKLPAFFCSPYRQWERIDLGLGSKKRFAQKLCAPLSTKRRFGKAEQKMMICGFWKHFSRAWVLNFGYEPLKWQSKSAEHLLLLRPKSSFGRDRDMNWGELPTAGLKVLNLTARTSTATLDRHRAMDLDSVFDNTESMYSYTLCISSNERCSQHLWKPLGVS